MGNCSKREAGSRLGFVARGEAVLGRLKWLHSAAKSSLEQLMAEAPILYSKESLRDFVLEEKLINGNLG
jgi:hypothetical protein